ncbi:hypothetical protein FAES_3885 [Fibrella aestuarina BUZ 2]|uniref:Lipoprotein n=1 Tax=Fibrella aestuarina BUZ 2 TaxID=1166018 RepID=I0KCN8_9BACT|nr:hypothetical protein FAES_3885 [Fibrella aestuarina BUZ 2]
MRFLWSEFIDNKKSKKPDAGSTCGLVACFWLGG